MARFYLESTGVMRVLDACLARPCAVVTLLNGGVFFPPCRGYTLLN